MSNNLELMQKIAWTSKHIKKQNCYYENTDLITKEQPRNFCDDDLDNIFNHKDWWEDTWWKP